MKRALRAAPRRMLATVPALALVAAALPASSSGTSMAASTDIVATISPDEYYINYAEPAVQPDSAGKEIKGKGGVYESPIDRAKVFDRKHAHGNPLTARQLARLEAQSIKTGKSPRRIKQAKSTQVARLLTILVEFNERADDDFTDTMVPATVFDDRTCVPGTIQNGPLHNSIPNPASLPHKDNNTLWVPDFSPEHFNKMLYSKTGITERVRKDLIGPDGRPGISLAGKTLHNMYLEMSKGAYTVTGEATPW